MKRRFLTRLLAGTATLAALVAAVTAFAGSSFAGGSAALATYGPQNVSAPSFRGTAVAGDTLTAVIGTWKYQSTPTYTYQWAVCNASGAGCANLDGLTGSTFTIGQAQVGHTIRLIVTAHNSDGATSAKSGPSAVVKASGSGGSTAPGAVKLANGKTSIPASSVVLPDRLVISSVSFTPRRLTSRAPFQARVRISDTRGNVVRDALVYVLGAPYAWVQKGVEVRTDQTGSATLTITPSASMPLGRGSLLLFVRARVEGQKVLAGSSTRRLVNILIRG
jgi:hypothetical protein